jgi:type IV secretion system protein VirB4
VGSVRNLISILDFPQDGVFRTKHGHAGLVLNAAPVPSECLDEEEVDQFTSVFASTLRLLDPRCRVYQYLLKRPAPDIQASVRKGPVVRQAIKERIEHCRGRRMFTLDTYFVVVLEDEEPIGDVDAAFQISVRILRETTQNFIEGAAFIKLKILDSNDAFLFFRRLVNFAPGLAEATPNLNLEDEVDFQIANSSVECKPVLVVGGETVRALYMRTTPRRTRANLLWSLLEIPCGMSLVTEWKPLPIEKTQRIITTWKRHHLNTARTLGMSKTPHEGKQAVVAQLGRTLEEIEVENVFFGEMSLAVLLFDQDAVRVGGAVSKAHAAIQRVQGSFVEPLGKGALITWLATVPGNQAYNVRYHRMSHLNYADMSLLFGVASGDRWTPQLRDEYVAVLETRHGTPYYLVIHDGEVGNLLITGMPGAGKSFLTGFLITHYQKFDPITAVFDIGGGYKFLTKRFGGAYVDLSSAGGVDSAKINPFSLPPTEAAYSLVSGLVTMLLEMHGPELAADELKDVSTQVRSVFAMPLGLRRLREVTLRGRLMERLSPWVATRDRDGHEHVGEFAYLFDNVEDTLTEADFQTFNFPADSQKNKDVREALLFYVLGWLDIRLGEDTRRPKMIVVDEAWKFIRHRSTREFIVNALKTWRKRNAVLVLVTHTIQDVDADLLDDVKMAVVTRIHGANGDITEDAWQRGCNLKKAETALIKSLAKPDQTADGRRTPSEFLIQGKGVVRLSVDDNWFPLYANSAWSMVEREEAVSRLGFEEGLRSLRTNKGRSYEGNGTQSISDGGNRGVGVPGQ